MKKLFLVISLVLMISCLVVACSSSEPTETSAPETSAPTNAPETGAPTNAPETSAPQTEAPTECNHYWQDANCISPKTCVYCGMTQGTTIAHSFDGGALEPSCTEPETLRTCYICGAPEEVLWETLAHSWVEASCIAPKTCAICGITEGETLPHNWVEATCTTPKTCSVCNATEGYPVHVLGTDGKCTKCGARSIPMTDAEREASMAVKTMDHSVSEYSDELSLGISFDDENGYSKKAPAYVDVKIVGEDGAVLYSNTLLKKTSERSVTIDYDDIIPSKSGKGTVYYKVYNDYFSFEEVPAALEKLPWTVDIELPQLPAEVWYYDDAKYKITNITYKISGNRVTFYFSGECLFDTNGDNYSRSVHIGWKLYDSEGYVLSDGTFYGNSLKVGEKFKDGAETLYGATIEQGKSYRLELLNIG